MTFRDREKQRYQSVLKKIFDNDPMGGFFAGKSRDFCLLNPDRNLEKSIRQDALLYFQDRKITWHSGTKANHINFPSSHLCCSQSACVNFLFPLIRSKEGVEKLLKGFGYDVKEALPIVGDQIGSQAQAFIGFEWIGAQNYLGEKVMKSGERFRGRYSTSADFVFRFKSSDDQVHVVLGEWKYTEEYSSRSMAINSNGTNRVDIYRKALNDPKCQILIKGFSIDDLFYDPFDQLMRLQLLASMMEKHNEMGASVVSVLHIVPRANGEFNQNITSAKLANMGANIHRIWKSIAKSEKFIGLYLEDVFSSFIASYPEKETKDYIQTRYSGMK